MYRVILTHFEDQEWLQDPTQAQPKQVGGCASTSKQRKAPRQGQLRACTKVRDELMDGMKSTCQVNKELGASALYIMTLHCTICEIIDEGAVGVLIRTTRKRYHITVCLDSRYKLNEQAGQAGFVLKETTTDQQVPTALC